MIKFIDTHAHLYLCKKPIDDLLKSAILHGVIKIVLPGINLQTSQRACELACEYSYQIILAIGIHPSEKPGTNDLDCLQDLIHQYPVKAIGEIGLDYFRNTQPREDQIELFKKQLQLAESNNLPVLIHNRDADEDIHAILLEYPDLPKVFHCYSSDMALAQKWVHTNAYFSFSGNITYKNKDKIHETIKYLPLDKILIETDCPYITPMTHKGMENEPGFVIEIAKKIAQIKEIPLELVAQETTKNAQNVFH